MSFKAYTKEKEIVEKKGKIDQKKATIKYIEKSLTRAEGRINEMKKILEEQKDELEKLEKEGKEV